MLTLQRKSAKVYNVLFRKAKIFLLSAFVAFAISLVGTGCSMGSASSTTQFSDQEDNNLPIRRYDLLELRYLTTGDYSALQKMRTTYVVETRALVEDMLKICFVGDNDMNTKFREFYSDSTLHKMLDAVDKEFRDMDDENEQLLDCFDRMDDLLPNVEKPEVYTQIGDFEQSVIVSGKLVGISLDKYLGADYPTYKRFYSADQRKQMTREYIVPDCICVYLLSKFPMKNFEHASQERRDFHMQTVWYTANKILGEDFFSSAQISKADAFMQVHKDMTLEQLLGSY